jgi:hypothetical protein
MLDDAPSCVLAPTLLGPQLRTPNPGFHPGLTPRICNIKGGGEPRVKPGVWRPEISALVGYMNCNVLQQHRYCRVYETHLCELLPWSE